MTLYGLRQSLVKRTGRWDLVSDRNSFADNGANAIIQAGQDYIDSAFGNRIICRRYQVDLLRTPIVEVKHLLTPTSVWAVGHDGRIELNMLTSSEYRNLFGETIPDMTTGTPMYYSQVVLALAPSQEDLKTDDYDEEFTYEYSDLMFSDEGNYGDYTCLLILPPPDETHTIIVEGIFRSVYLSDTSSTYWSTRFPELVILAARAFLEFDQRNMSGGTNYLAIVDELLSKQRDTAAEATVIELDPQKYI